MTMYAWSPILTGKPGSREDGPGEITRVKVGEEVSPDSLGVDQLEFNGMVASGSIRSYEPPKVPETFQGSPIDFLKEQAARASDDATNSVMASPEVIAAITASTTAATGSALSPENIDPEVQAEWERQREDNTPEGGTQEPTPGGNTGTTQVNDDTESITPGAGGTTGGTTFRDTSDGLFASDDGGSTWRPATDEEKANQ